MNESSLKAVSAVCRTCRAQITDSVDMVLLESEVAASDSTATIQNKLSCCIPELDFNIQCSLAVCSHCVAAIDFFYKFKQKCLETQQHFRSVIQKSQEVVNSTVSDAVIGNTTSSTSLSGQQSNFHFERIDRSLVSFNDLVTVSNIEVATENTNNSSPSSNTVPGDTISDFGSVTLPNCYKKFRCPDCSYSTESVFKIWGHIKTHENGKRKLANRIPNWLNFSCCGCTGKTDQNMYVLLNSLKGRLECSKCHICTTNEREFVAHKECHRIGVILKCTECSFVTTTVRLLRIHCQNLHKNFVFTCKLCSRKFVWCRNAPFGAEVRHSEALEDSEVIYVD